MAIYDLIDSIQTVLTLEVNPSRFDFSKRKDHVVVV